MQPSARKRGERDAILTGLNSLGAESDTNAGWSTPELSVQLLHGKLALSASQLLAALNQSRSQTIPCLSHASLQLSA
jgi:hypothetical protein